MRSRLLLLVSQSARQLEMHEERMRYPCNYCCWVEGMVMETVIACCCLIDKSLTHQDGSILFQSYSERN